MALQDMFIEIQQETLKEIDDYKNRATIEATKSLMEKGESLENFYKEKKEKFIAHLEKHEEMLKAEQDFICRTTTLKENEAFYDKLLENLNHELLQYIEDHQSEYKKILNSWLQKSINSMDSDQLTFKVSSKDMDMIQSLLKELSPKSIVEVDHDIKAGFLVFSDKGVKIDLSFQTLFHERKQNLLSISIRILKERL